MANVQINRDRGPLEVDSNMHALISFRAIVAGVLIAMFTMTGLIGLGLAFGGMGLDPETTAQSAGIFSGVWFVASVLVSLFLGSYFAARVSKFRSGRVGSVQGLVIAALFLGFFLYQMISALGSAGSALGGFIGQSGSAISAGVQKAAGNPTVANTIGNFTEDALGDLNLRSDPQVVAQGLGTRLVRGDTEGARNYLARQAGISPTEADARIAQMKGQVDRYVTDAKEGAATALRSTGWTLFLMVLLGALAAIGGGALGSAANFRKPLVRESDSYYPPGQTV
jgi:hypothetical protein